MKSLSVSITTLIILFIFSSISFTQQKISDNTLKEYWQRIEQYEKERLPKSALALLDTIYNEAIRLKDSQQLIKTLVYKYKFIKDFEPDAYSQIISQLQNETDENKFPIKNILHSILASVYESYLTDNQYKIISRTETTGYKTEDFSTWSFNNFTEKINYHFNNSLQGENELQKIPIEKFVEILIDTNETLRFRPTLFDLLSHRFLNYLQKDDNNITKPVEEFLITSLDGFLSAEDFINKDFHSPDTSSPKYKAINIYKELISFHKKNNNIDALIDIDLWRLIFFHNITINDEKGTAFLNALDKLADKYRNENRTAAVHLERAAIYFMNDNLPYPKTFLSSKAMAKSICEFIITNYTDTKYSAKAKVILNQINQKSYTISFEKTTLPAKPFRGSISFQNIDKINFHIVRLSDNLLRFDSNNEINYDSILTLNPSSKFSVDLPLEEDYLNHTVEFPVQSLSVGFYLVVSFIEDENGKTFFSHSTFNVTNISYFYINNRSNEYELYVSDASTGLPLKNVKVNVFDNKKSTTNISPDLTFTTNEKGFVNLNFKTGIQNIFYKIQLIYGDDIYIPQETFFVYSYWGSNNQSESNIRTFFFTDRSIYRPGQTLFFKGIVINEKNRKEKNIVQGHNSTVTLFNTNNQKVSEVKVKTNEYGSFEGSFIIPQGMLTGNFRIQNETGSVSVSVEEYKRPTFEITFDKVKESFRLNDSITVNGNAKTYSDAVVGNAIVSYRVVRNVRFPIWGWWRNPFPSSPEKEIANGKTETSSNGEFSIAFFAEPDLSVPLKDSPVFTYTVSVDITDLAGETRSNKTLISAGYSALEINVNTKQYNHSDEVNFALINTLNLDGEFIPAKGKVIIEKLKQPKRILRNRLWDSPDRFILSEDEFIKLFPNDLYKDENELTNLITEKIVYEGNFSSDDKRKTDSLQLNYSPGVYKIKVSSSDVFGYEVETENYFYVFNEKETGVLEPNIFIPVTSSAEPGEDAVLYWGSAYKSANGLLQIYHSGKKIFERNITVDESVEKIKIPIKEEYRGGISVRIFFIKENRFYSNEHFIAVPWSNKELDFEFVTFRDKLLPGDEEEWKIIIKGKNKDKIASELAVTMYDASLDVFRKHNWFFSIWHQNYQWLQVNNNYDITSLNSGSQFIEYTTEFDYEKYYNLNLKNLSYSFPLLMKLSNNIFMPFAMSNIRGGREVEVAYYSVVESTNAKHAEFDAPTKPSIELKSDDDFSPQPEPVIELRKNLNETAFFFPKLLTNENGEVIISFKMPDALTRWRLLGLAHSKDLQIGSFEKNVITQKNVMIIPHLPRFLRADDKIVLTATVYNLTDEIHSGTANLELFDAVTMKPISNEFNLVVKERDFTVSAEQSTLVSWEIKVPQNIESIIYRFTASAETHTDGEEGNLPVLPNRMLVTETLPINIRGEETKKIIFEPILNSGVSSTHTPFSFTLEMTSNPVWYAVHALPFLDDVRYESSINLFAKYFSNRVSSKIVQSNQKIKRIFEQWRDKDALISNLEKNEELKNILLEETPWVINAQNESERKKKIGLLFEENYIRNSLRVTLDKLKKLQNPDGGFSWFTGMNSNLFVTQFILNGFGYLKQLEIINNNDREIYSMITRALNYYDLEMKKEFDQHKKTNKHFHYNPNYSTGYVYVRSFFYDIPLTEKCDSSFNYHLNKVETEWNDKNLMMQGMSAIALYKFGKVNTANSIMKSLKERAIYSEELGMYWKENSGGYYWFNAAIETQAILLEAFNIVSGDMKSVEEMKIWLLKNKQVQDWKTTIATAKAIYALLMRGEDLLFSDELVKIDIAGKNLLPSKQNEIEIEAGTGYFKKTWLKNEIEQNLGEVEITNPNKNIAWGGLYYQYFEQLDKIGKQNTQLSINKELFIERKTNRGPVLETINDENKIKVGDLVKVRLEIRVDRDMEFVHLKDMRGAGFEPVNIISRTKYQGGLLYYESTLDASTNFFFQYLPKGTYVFEYPLRAAHKGKFSNGISTIQCLYAPEFSSHTEGRIISVE